MPDWLIFTGGVLLFVAILSITVALHEGGHMVAAKALKLKVPEFAVGFGPRLFGKKGKKTDYNVRLLPLGGFVSIEDESQPEGSFERNSLSHVAPWKRQIVYFAGPFVNLVLGSALLLVALMGFPYYVGNTMVQAVQTCDAGACGSLQAGILPDDKILEVDGKTVTLLPDIEREKKGKDSIDVLVEREGTEILIENVKLGEDGLMGVVVDTTQAYRTLPQAVTFVGQTIHENIEAIFRIPEKVVPVAQSIVTGERPADSPGSVVSIGKTYGDVAVAPVEETGDKLYIYIIYSALFNLSLGLINLLPIVPLDGGRMLIALFDSCKRLWSKITKKLYTPTGKAVYGVITAIGVVIVFGFMGMLILSDFSLIAHGNM